MLFKFNLYFVCFVNYVFKGSGDFLVDVFVFVKFIIEWGLVFLFLLKVLVDRLG